jgi:hypothetical protein
MAYEAQQRSNAQSVLRLLALGLNPQTGLPLPPEEIVHSADVIRALMLAIESLEASGRRTGGTHGERFVERASHGNKCKMNS